MYRFFPPFKILHNSFISLAQAVEDKLSLFKSLICKQQQGYINLKNTCKILEINHVLLRLFSTTSNIKTAPLFILLLSEHSRTYSASNLFLKNHSLPTLQKIHPSKKMIY